MKAMLTIFRWECRRILSNWRQSVAVFLIPAVVLLGALYVFPLLVSYLSTGSVTRPTVVLVAPDNASMPFFKTDSMASQYTYSVWSREKFESSVKDGTDSAVSARGGFFAVFTTDNADSAAVSDGFASSVQSFFSDIKEDPDAVTHAVVTIYFDPGSIMSYTLAYQFKEDVLPLYSDYLLQTEGRDIYSGGGGDPFLIDAFNPYMKLMESRANANPAASRVLPGILILLLYYCVYSLSGDLLAADRERGFLSKLKLTPISTRSLLFGKALAVIAISVMTSLVTLLILFLSSWANRTNNPLSLIPFGLLLTPVELAYTILSILSAAVLMTMYTFKVIMDLTKMSDITMNLQFPLILFLIDFFLQIFRYSSPVLTEYAIPLHNNLILIRNVMTGSIQVVQVLFVVLYDLAIAFFLYRNAAARFGQEDKRRINKRRRFV
jgi:ABC-type Na+ efflux pump permease subunit